MNFCGEPGAKNDSQDDGQNQTAELEHGFEKSLVESPENDEGENGDQQDVEEELHDEYSFQLDADAVKSAWRRRVA